MDKTNNKDTIEKQPEKKMLHMPDRWIEGAFADQVQMSADPNHMSFSFLQRIPFIKDDEENTEQSVVVARINMTWPHIFRFQKLLHKIISERKEGVIQYLEEVSREEKTNVEE